MHPVSHQAPHDMGCQLENEELSIPFEKALRISQEPSMAVKMPNLTRLTSPILVKSQEDYCGRNGTIRPQVNVSTRDTRVLLVCWPFQRGVVDSFGETPSSEKAQRVQTRSELSSPEPHISSCLGM